jgi:hypothetical protein
MPSLEGIFHLLDTWRVGCRFTVFGAKGGALFSKIPPLTGVLGVFPLKNSQNSLIFGRNNEANRTDSFEGLYK